MSPSRIEGDELAFPMHMIRRPGKIEKFGKVLGYKARKSEQQAAKTEQLRLEIEQKSFKSEQLA
jgi:hypothetical protein